MRMIRRAQLKPQGKKEPGGLLHLPTEIPAGFVQTGPEGLTGAEAAARIQTGKANVITSEAGKSVFQIVVSNVFTLFNLLNLTLAVCLLLVGSYRNMLFMMIVVSNTGIAIIQEIRARKAIERMKLLNAANVRVIREGEEISILPEQTVEGDLAVLRTGDQVPADAVVLTGRGSAMESLLTGESDAVSKAEGSWL